MGRKFYFIAEEQKRDEHGALFRSSPKKKRPAHHKTHLHTMKVYNSRPFSLTIEVLLIKIPLFLTIIHLFQSNQRFQAIRFVDRLVPEKLDIFGINLS